jgi:hypothetical protein
MERRAGRAFWKPALPRVPVSLTKSTSSVGARGGELNGDSDMETRFDGKRDREATGPLPIPFSMPRYSNGRRAL